MSCPSKSLQLSPARASRSVRQKRSGVSASTLAQQPFKPLSKLPVAKQLQISKWPASSSSESTPQTGRFQSLELLNQRSGKSAAETKLIVYDPDSDIPWADQMGLRGSLSGGGISRLDKFPNYMSFKVQQDGVNLFNNDQIVTPISRLSRGGKKVTIMELLWVDFDYINIGFLAPGDSVIVGMSTGQFPIIAPTQGDPEVLFTHRTLIQGVGASWITTFNAQRYNFQSEDGHGLLMATDSFNAWIDTTGMAAVVTWSARVFYRFVEVGVTEYIGIVQSQQQN